MALKAALLELIATAERDSGTATVQQWLDERKKGDASLEVSRECVHAVLKAADRAHGRYSVDKWVKEFEGPQFEPARGKQSPPRSVRRPTSPTPASAVATQSHDNGRPTAGPPTMLTKAWYAQWNHAVTAAIRPLSSFTVHVRIRSEALTNLQLCLEDGLSGLRERAVSTNDPFFEGAKRIIPVLGFHLGCKDRQIARIIISILSIMVDIAGVLFHTLAKGVGKRILDVIDAPAMYTVDEELQELLRAMALQGDCVSLSLDLAAYIVRPDAGKERKAFAAELLGELLARFSEKHLCRVRYLVEDMVSPFSYVVPFHVAQDERHPQCPALRDGGSTVLGSLRKHLAVKHQTSTAEVSMVSADLTDMGDECPYGGIEVHPLLAVIDIESVLTSHSDPHNDVNGRSSSVSTDRGNSLSVAADELKNFSPIDSPTDASDYATSRARKALANIHDSLFKTLAVVSVPSNAAKLIATSLHLMFPFRFAEQVVDLEETRGLALVDSILDTENMRSSFPVFVNPIASQHASSGFFVVESPDPVALEHHHHNRKRRSSRGTVQVHTPSQFRNPGPHRTVSPTRSVISAPGLSRGSRSRSRQRTAGSTTMMVPPAADTISIGGHSRQAHAAPSVTSRPTVSLLGSRRK